MKKKLLTHLSVLVATAALSQAAWSQDDTTGMDATREASGGSFARGITVEVKPLPILLSAIPGVGSISGGVEGMVAPNIAAFGEVAILSSNLPERLEGTAKDELGQNDLYANRVKGGSVDLGARFYLNPLGHSWFTQAKAGYQEMSTEWVYQDQTVNQRFATFTPGIGAGYRWRFADPSIVVRLGAGAAANIVQAQEVTADAETSVTQEAREKLDKAADTQVLANVDLGLGYMF